MDRKFTGTALIAALFVCGCGQPATDNGSSTAATSEPAIATANGSAEIAVVETPPPEQGRELPPEQSEPATDSDASSSATSDVATAASVTEAQTTGQPRNPARRGATDRTPAEPKPDVTAGDITLVDLPWESVVEQIAAHNGKIVVVDLWATYCAPCRESFPGLVVLSKQDPENIACISVSLDDPEDAEKRAEAITFLQEQQAAFQNFLCTTDADTLYDEILKIGGVPAVYVYGRDGQLAKLFTGPAPGGEEHTYEQHITPFVTELAAAK